MPNSSVSVDFFASELRRARQAVGLTQEQLAQAISYSLSLVAMIELGRRSPSADFARRSDEVLKTDGLLLRVRDNLVTKEVVPQWFRPWVLVEEEATAFRWYEPLMVPGLLQTEEYAHAVLRSVDEPADRVERRVAARMERQRIFEREHPPVFVGLLDERVLRCPIGGPAVMHRQLRRLAEVAERTLIQVVPLTAGTYHGLAGQFVIAAVEGTEVVYVDTQLRGMVVNNVDVVAETRHRWDAIRAEALPRQQSLDLILEAAESWNS